MKKVLSLILLLALAGTGRAAFELERPGARAAGMAGAFSAVADDNDALLYNPAGLAGLTEACLSTSWADLYAGLDDGQLTESQLAFTYPMAIPGSLGVLWHQRNLFDLYQENQISLGYGQALDPDKTWTAGAVVDLLMLQYTDAQALAQDDFLKNHATLFTASLDAGVLYLPASHWRIGLSASHINQPNIAVLEEPVLLSLQLRAGVAYQDNNFKTGLDWTMTDGTYRWSVGGEYWWFERLLATRAGLALTTDGLQEMTGGLSLNWLQVHGGLQLDYAFVLPLGEKIYFGSSHYIGLSWHFGGTPLSPLEQEGRRLKAFGRAALDKGDYRQALDAWEEAVEYLPDDKQLAKALSSLRDEVDKQSEFDIYKKQAANYEANHDWRNAAKAYRKALNIIPENDDVNRAWKRARQQLQTMDKEEQRKRRAKERKIDREMKVNATRHLTEANHLLTQNQRRGDMQRYFKEDLEKLDDLLKKAKTAYRRRDYEAANDKSVSLINDIQRLEERVAIKVKAAAKKRENRSRPRPVSANPTPRVTATVQPARQGQPRLEGKARLHRKVNGPKKLRRRARGAYGRAVKLMIEIDQKKGDTYFPEQYQKMKNNLVVIKTKLQHGDYDSTIAKAEALFPHLEKLKKKCEQKEAARKALPTGW